MEYSTKLENIITGCIALLPLLATILFYVTFIEGVIKVKIIFTLGLTLFTCYGILKLAEPLAEESNEKRRLL